MQQMPQSILRHLLKKCDKSIMLQLQEAATSCGGPMVFRPSVLPEFTSPSSLRQYMSRPYFPGSSQLILSNCSRTPASVFHQQIRGFAEKAVNKGWGKSQPVTMQGLLIAMMVGAAGIAAVKSYKDEKLKQVMVQSQQVVGKASVGGPFELTDFNGKTFTNRDLLGEFAILYFGFTHCPDICPDELEKVSEAIDIVEKQTGVFVQPVFISVDPERDTAARIKAYVQEFHPRMFGLTGDLEDVKKTSKAYRVYYSKTGEPGAKDYLVDHSIIHYLIDPDGEFVTFYGKNYDADQMADSLHEHIANWKASHQNYHPGRTIAAPPAKEEAAKTA